MTRPSWQDFGTHDESAYPELWAGVVGAWAPCLGPTGSRLHDHSRRNNWGTLTNMDAATDWVVSGGQYALDFDGSNDYVSVPTCPLFASNATTFTVALWFRTDSTAIDNDYNMMWSNAAGDPPTNSGIDIWCDDRGFGSDNTRRNGIAAAWRTATGSYAGVGANDIITSTAVWRHLAIVWDLATPRMYVDGVLTGGKWAVTSGTGAFVPRNAEVSIARLSGGTGEFPGQLDDISIYSRALSANEIRQLYLLGRGGMYQRRRRTLRRVAIEQPTGARRRRILTGMV